MNEWLQYAAVIAAIIVAASPHLRQVLAGFSWPSLGGGSKPSPAQSAPTFKQSIDALSVVRTRVVATGHFDDAQKQAVDALTLALVDGSDQ